MDMDNAAAAAAADDGVVVAPGDPFKTKAAELAAAFDAETEVLVQGHIEGWTAQCENEADEMLGVTKQHRRRLYGEAARYVQMLSMVRGQRNLDFKPSQYTVPLEAARLDLLFKEAIQYTQSRKWGRTTAHIPPPTVVLMLLVMIGKARFHNNPLLPTPDYSAFMLKISRTPEYPLLLDAMLAFNFIMLWQWYIETKFVPNGCRYAQADPRLPKWPASNEDLAAMGMPCQCGMAKDSEAGVRSLETAKAIRQHMLERFKAAGAAPPKKKESKSGKRARPDE